MRTRMLPVLLLIMALSFWIGRPVAAAPLRAPGEGQITSLIMAGAQNPGDPIDIDSSVLATTKCQNTNLYYEVYSPTMVLVDTRQVGPPKLDPGESYDDSWSTYNTPETGDYTVTLCWSTGASPNCNIDYAETTAWSVPTLGAGLSILALCLTGLWLYLHRADFAGAAR
jgi:hypothetical protein